MIQGRNILIYEGDVVIAAAKSCTINNNAEALENSSPASGTARSYTVGRTGWDISISTLVLGMKDHLLKVGQAYRLVWKVRGNDSDAMQGTAICTNAQVEATVGNLAQGSFQFLGSDDNGTIVTPPTPTPSDYVTEQDVVNIINQYDFTTEQWVQNYAGIANGMITIGHNSISPVTSVAMTVPTGFSVSGSPISKTGTLALAYATGYEGFTTALKEKIEALYSWFEVDADGDVKTKDTAGGHVRGLYSESFVSSLGKNSSSGGGGVDMTAVWASLTNTDSPTYSETLKININHIPNIGWSKIDNKPTTLAGYGITDAKIASGTITLGSNTITPLTASSSLAWGKLTGTPTTLAGYGIGDAKIANGVITLGSSTITPVTSVAMTVPTGFSVSGSPISKTGTLALAYATGYEGFTTALKEKIEALYSWFEVDAAGDIKTKDMPNGTHRGFYTESFVSALGANSQGGGSSTFDEPQMWTALQSTTGTYATTKIATSHIPDMASTYGYLKSSALNGYATQAWVNQQGFLTTHQSIYALTLKADGTAVTTFTPNSADASLDFVAGSNISLTRGTNQITIANTYSYTLPLAASGTRGGVQIGYSETNSGTSTTRNYAVKLSSEKMYVNVPWTDTTYKLTLNGTTNGASGGTSLGSFYAPTASGTSNQVLISGGSNTAPSWTAQSNLSVGTATKLNTGTTTYTAWGQTYWSSGVPQSISGNMTSVGSITPSANGNALGTTSSRFNIYGTSGNFSGNVSITGTLGVTGATTLSSTLSVAGGITLTTTKKIYFGDTSHYLELDSTGFHFSHGVYSDSFVSALGANSSGGGGGGIDIEAMWAELQGNTGTYANAKINVNHIPDISSTYGYAKTSQLGNYLPLSGGTMTGTVWRKMTVDSSNYEVSVGWVNTSGSAIAEIGYLNTSQKIVINPTKAISPWTDAVGKYVLNVGNNLLTYNTYNILHANNYSDYALPLTGGTLQKSSGDTPLYIKSTNTSGAYIGYQLSDGTTMGFIGVHATYGAAYVKSGTVYPILRSDNYSSYALPLSGGTMTGSITFNAVNKGIYLKDSDGNTFAGIIQNSDNFWIGAQQTSATHHTGGTYISAGGNRNLYVSKLVNNTRTNYIILDTDNTYTSSGIGYIYGTEITTISGNAATATRLRLVSTNASPSDANDSTLVTGGIMYNYASTAYWRNTPSGMDYGSIICFSSGIGSLGAQFAWDVEHNSTTSTKKLWFRAQNNLGYQNDWKEIITSSGGTITGSLTVNSSVTALGYNAKFDVDTSREMGYDWLNTSGTKVASVTYHNTVQNIILNPVGSSDTWSDAVGKYSLIIGNNKLTYNTYTILHSNNYSSYALPLSGGTMTGTLKWANGTALPNATTADYLLTIDAFSSGGTTKWIGASSVTVGRATNADNADKLDGIDSRSIDSIYTGGWCAGTGTYYGKIAEYTSGTSGTVDCTATFLLTDYQTTGASSGNILVVRFRSSSPTSTPIINASWAVKNSDMDIYVRYQISNSRTYVRIYSLSAGWGRAINIKLLRAHSWSGSNITSWVLYSATNTTSGDVAAYSSLPTAETAVTVTNNNIIAGEVTATSDERLKTIVGDGNLDLRYIANAPNILFKWNNGQDDKVHGGSLAQYFLTGAKHFVLGSDKDFYSLNYGALATSMAISIAKEVVKHEDRITLLEKENAKLKARVAELEERRVA